MEFLFPVFLVTFTCHLYLSSRTTASHLTSPMAQALS